MKKLFCGFLLLPVVSFAHLELKKYPCVAPADVACEVEVKAITFQNDMKHPLNERVEVIFQNRTHFLRHPETVDMQTGAIGFNHDLLQETVATSSGAESITLMMSHEVGKEGPVELVISTHNWKTNKIERTSYPLK